jgi:hypothetical protein
MTNDERKPIVQQQLAAGRSLSEILDYLHKEQDDHITYMELRLLLSEMPNAKLPEKERLKTPPPSPLTAPAGRADQPAAAAEPGSKLNISIDQTPAPGSMLSGYARFSSGAKAHWFLDEMGRLGLEPELGTGKPTEADMKEFSAQLRKMLQQAGGPM